MDILRKELDLFYESQNLSQEKLDPNILCHSKQQVMISSEVDNNCRVITDAALDHCFIFGGSFGCHLGISNSNNFECELNSSDEDIIYNRIHPEDLVDKRMLEYEYFKFIDRQPVEKKINFKATCRIRIKNKDGIYIYVDNSTQVLQLSPNGKVWLILCCYNFSPNQKAQYGITPAIINFAEGEVKEVNLTEKRKQILTDREKEILQLIKEGKLSKQIADILGISVNTVNRHRQNVLEKLSVGNSVEAVMAATLMNLL